MGNKNNPGSGNANRLRQAVKDENSAQVQACLKKGAAVNSSWTNRYIQKETPLMLASDSGSAEIVELLLKNGADVHARTTSVSPGGGDLTALHYALNPGRKTPGYLAIIKLLLAAGGDPDSANNNGMTPLALAAQKGWKEAVSALLNAGARAQERSGAKHPPLHAAVISGDTVVVKMLLEKSAPVDCRNEKGDTPLMVAAWNGNEQMVDLLLAQQADPQVVNNLGQTVLMAAALFARDAEDENHKKAILLLKRLLKLEIPINAADKNGKTAFDHAKAAYEPAIPKFLKANGAQPGGKKS